MYTLLALSPILVVFLLLVVLRWSAKAAMAVALAVTAALSLTVWKTAPNVVAAAAAIGALPKPASLEKIPRATPD